jgi:hypothetical protein
MKPPTKNNDASEDAFEQIEDTDGPIHPEGRVGVKLFEDFAMSVESNFWQWFKKNEEELSNADFDEEIFDNLATRLQRVDPHLTFELGSKSSQRDFIISAGGIKSSFPAVRPWRVQHRSRLAGT